MTDPAYAGENYELTYGDLDLFRVFRDAFLWSLIPAPPQNVGIPHSHSATGPCIECGRICRWSASSMFRGWFYAKRLEVCLDCRKKEKEIEDALL